MGRCAAGMRGEASGRFSGRVGVVRVRRLDRNEVEAVALFFTTIQSETLASHDNLPSVFGHAKLPL